MFPNTVVCFEIDSADVVVMSMNDEGCKTAIFLQCFCSAAGVHILVKITFTACSYNLARAGGWWWCEGCCLSALFQFSVFIIFLHIKIIYWSQSTDTCQEGELRSLRSPGHSPFQTIFERLSDLTQHWTRKWWISETRKHATSICQERSR